MNGHEKAMLRSELGYARNRLSEGMKHLERLRDEQIDRIEDKINYQTNRIQFDSANIDEIKRLLLAMNEPKREPAIDVIGIVEMKTGLWDSEFYDLNIDNRDDLTDLLEPYNGKRVRVTVELVEEGTD